MDFKAAEIATSQIISIIEQADYAECEALVIQFEQPTAQLTSLVEQYQTALAADKKAMLEVDQCLSDPAYDAQMIMQVHDELIVEVADQQAEEVKALLIEKMMNAVRLDVPLIVDAEIGDNWDQAH